MNSLETKAGNGVQVPEQLLIPFGSTRLPYKDYVNAIVASRDDSECEEEPVVSSISITDEEVLAIHATELSPTSIQYEVLIEGPICGVYNYIALIDLIGNARATDKIIIYLDTPGGQVDTGLAICDAMLRSKASIKTVAVGECASMGAIIFTYGQEFDIRHWADVMFHGVSGVRYGKFYELAEDITTYTEMFGDIMYVAVEKGLLTESEFEDVVVRKLDLFIPSEVMRDRIRNINTNPGGTE